MLVESVVASAAAADDVVGCVLDVVASLSFGLRVVSLLFDILLTRFRSFSILERFD